MVKITNQEQFKTLIQLMEQNTPLATNFRRGVSQTEEKKKEWRSVSDELNSLGPPVRTEKEWQKVWFDAKYKVKQKLLHNKKELETTGGGPFRQKYLNESDQAIANLLQLNNVVDPEGVVFGGCSHVQEQISTVVVQPPSTDSLPSTEQFMLNLNNSTTEMAQVTGEQNSRSEELSGNTPGLSFIQLLERQTDVQETLYHEIQGALKKIEDHLKESARYQRKRFHLEEEKMKREEEQQKKDNEMKIIDLELKKRKLDLKEKKLKLLEQ